MFGILTLVNPDVKEINLCKREGHFWELHPYALHVISVLLPLMPEEFIKHRGTNRCCNALKIIETINYSSEEINLFRLLMILEWAMLEEFDSQLILNCVKTINYITMSGKEAILKEFRAQGAIATLISENLLYILPIFLSLKKSSLCKLFTELVHFVLSASVIKSQHQRILTHVMMILETLVKNERYYQTLYSEQSVKMVLKILQRLLYDKRGYFKLDNR